MSARPDIVGYLASSEIRTSLPSHVDGHMKTNEIRDVLMPKRL